MAKKYINIENAVTHNGKAHADDIFAAAFLRILNSDIKITRVAIVPNKFSGIAFDIGMGEFDHHQAKNEKRANGVPYAAFGKLWRKFAPLILDENGVENIDEILVQHIDLADNGGQTNLLTIMFSQMNPAWDTEDDVADEYFEKSIAIAKNILVCMMGIEKTKQRGEIPDSFIIKEDINKVVNDLFCEAVCDAMISVGKGREYEKEIVKSIKYERNKQKVYDDNNKRIASVTATWEDFGTISTIPQAAAIVRKSFFENIDNLIMEDAVDDTLVYVFSYISEYVEEFRKYYKKIIKRWLLNQIEDAESKISVKEVLIKAIQETKDDEIIILDKFYPWHGVLIDSLAKFVVYPSTRSGFTMHTVPCSKSDSSPRLPFPDYWNTTPISSIKNDIRGITFVHKGGMLITCETIEDCVKAAEISNNEYMKRALKSEEMDAVRKYITKNNGENEITKESIKNALIKYNNKQLQFFDNKLAHLYFRLPQRKEYLKQIRKIIKEIIYDNEFKVHKEETLEEILSGLSTNK